MTQFLFIGWCRVGGHDKVWAVIELERNRRYASIWGARGKKLQSKILDRDVGEVSLLIGSKKRKYYEECSVEKLQAVYPEFQTDLEQMAFWTALKG
jgi:hypothetical protein